LAAVIARSGKPVDNPVSISRLLLTFLVPGSSIIGMKGVKNLILI